MTTYDLVVVRPFGAYQRGDRITDQTTIADITNSEHAMNVVPVVAPPEPAPAPEPAPTMEEAVAAGVTAAEHILHPGS